MNDLSRQPWSSFELSLIPLAVLGVVLPWFAHVRFFASEGRFSLLRFFELAYANLPATAMSNELMIVFAVLVPWMLVEGRRSRIPHLWAYVLVAVLVAVAAAFPLFLLARERALRRVASVR